MTDASASTVCAVAVTYCPDAVALRLLMQALAGQVGAIVVVDNTPQADRLDGFPARILPPDAVLLRQPHNVGLATAQNIGIAWASKHGFRHVLLLDQDSEPQPGMVAALLAAHAQLSSQHAVGAVGPRFFDPRERRDAPFVQIGFPFNRKLWATEREPFVECDFLISSGALVPLEVLDKVGGMDDSLFIDNIDLDWSFRARGFGYRLFGVHAATMRHHLGDARRTLPLGAGEIVVHSPPRLYYMMRNRLRLYRRAHVPRTWIAQDLPRVLVKLFLFGVLVGPRVRNLRFMLRGLADGWRDRGGACPLR